jgi:phage N-6-adenine-methyltransferase
MSVLGYRSRNHPQQVAVNGADDETDDRATHPVHFAQFDEDFGPFTLDVAAAAHNAKCDRFFTLETNGLAQSWAGERVWCNPPYSDIEPWIRKAWLEHPNTDGIVMLLPNNRCEQRWWQRLVEPHRDRAGSGLRCIFLPGTDPVHQARRDRHRTQPATSLRMRPSRLEQRMTSACLISECGEPQWATMRLCSLHSGRALAALRSISSNAAEIRLSAGRSTAPQAQRVAGSRDPVLPAASLLGLDGPTNRGSLIHHDPKDDAEDHKDEPPVAFLLDQWARIVAEGRCNLPEPTIDALVGFLAAQHSWSCAQPWADDYYAEITDLSAVVRARAGNPSQPKRGTVPCKACGQRTLVQHEPSTPRRRADGSAELDAAGRFILDGGEYRCRNPECRAIESEDEHAERVMHYDEAIGQTREARSA